MTIVTAQIKHAIKSFDIKNVLNILPEPLQVSLHELYQSDIDNETDQAQEIVQEYGLTFDALHELYTLYNDAIHRKQDELGDATDQIKQIIDNNKLTPADVDSLPKSLINTLEALMQSDIDDNDVIAIEIMQEYDITSDDLFDLYELFCEYQRDELDAYLDS